MEDEGQVLDLRVPCIARANTRYISGKFIESKEHRDFKALVKSMLAEQGFKKAEGPLSVRITTFFPRQRHFEKEDGTKESFPFGDVDSTAKSTLDALEKAGFYDDDVKVEALMCYKHHTSEKKAWLRVEVWEMGE